MDKSVKKILLLMVKISVSGGLLYFVLLKAGINKVISLILNMSPFYFLLSVGLYFVVLFLCTVRWRLLLPDRFGLKKLFPIYLIGAFFNTILPGLVGGDAVRIYYLYKETGKGAQVLGSVFMDRYLGLITMMAMGLIAFPFGMKYFKGSWVEWILPAITFFIIVVSLVVFGLRLGKGIKFLNDFYDYFHMYRKKKGLMVKTFALSALLQVVVIFSIYILSYALGERIPLLTFFIFIPIIVAVSTLPISISGIGVREAASVMMLGSVGVKPEMATALSFAWFIMVIVGGIPGLVEYIRYKNVAS